MKYSFGMDVSLAEIDTSGDKSITPDEFDKFKRNK